MHIKIYEYLHKDVGGIAFKRISKAFHDFSPENITWVPTPNEADILLVHVLGASDFKILENKKPRVIIQHCYFTAGGTSSEEIINTWKNSLLTISFHDLQKYTTEQFPFYSMPWGADPDLFRHTNFGSRNYKAMVTGEVADTECLDKVFNSMKILNTRMLHTGKNFNWPSPYYTNVPHINDNEFVNLLNYADYIPSLRLVEGFELMAIEGLMCGARPIILDLDTYRWYKKYAYVINPNENIQDQLTDILRNSVRRVSVEERNEIVDKFSWSNIMTNFYNEFLKRI